MMDERAPACSAIQDVLREAVGAILVRRATRRARMRGAAEYDQGPIGSRALLDAEASRGHQGAMRTATVRRVTPGAIRVELPDTRQQEDYTCGASCFQSIAAYFGVLDSDCEESDLVKVMGIRSDCGAHPYHILRGIAHYKLEHEEYLGMSVDDVRRRLDAGIPVMMMLQAWHEPDGRTRRWRGYADEWNDGHWVAAIGYDAGVMYFEDPSLASRGYMTYDELRVRWHDVGPYWQKPYAKHMHNYGIAIWKNPVKRPAYYRTAAHIG